jgi:polyprenyl P-hydroxybenzoate/phenylacrylic acid decarboxylase-like protein
MDDGGGPRRIVVGVSGASGTLLASSVLELLGSAMVERHLVVSPAARRTARLELPEVRLESMAEVVHSWRDIGAPIASGGYHTDGMVVVPCSIRTLSSIAYGTTDSLISRAADVCLKERRRLVLSVRESPFHLGHLRAMTAVTEAGAIVAPPMPIFYAEPSSVTELVQQMAGRLVGLLGFATAAAPCWIGDRIEAAPSPRPVAGGRAEVSLPSDAEHDVVARYQPEDRRRGGTSI